MPDGRVTTAARTPGNATNAVEALRVVTGNRLRDGVPIYFAGAGGWSPQLAEARPVSPGEADALLAEAQAGPVPHPAVNPYLIEVERRDGRLAPQSLREKIRAFGPTVQPGAP
jgi:sulfite reductase (NADPH) hemoprotein beta-component